MTHPDHEAPAPQPDERILDHSRMQLSALMDGAVSVDEAKFLLRRLQHDEELANCWSRWQLCGDVLRGHADAIVDPGFPLRVAAAVRDTDVPSGTHAPRQPWLRWGGGAALAASVALVALFASRGVPDQQPPPQPTAVLAVQAPARVGPRVPAPAVPADPVAPVAPDRAAQVASAVAVADVPRRTARRARAASTRPVRVMQQLASDSRMVAETPSQAINPFAPRAAIGTRPWPRALLSGTSASGFNVDYGVGAARTYDPFAPRPTLLSTSRAPPPIPADEDSPR